MGRTIIRNYLPSSKPILEIGPYNCPFLSKDEYDVYYADVCSDEELFNGGYGNGVEGLAHIDYVVKGTYKESVGDKKFGAVFSSNVFEHIPNPIKHLLELADILDDDGRVVMCIPDKRFTFDYFREVTPLRDMYDVYINGEESLRRLIFDYNFLCDYSHKYADFMLNEVPFEDVLSVCDRKTAFPVESHQTHVHYWVFTDVSFLAVIRDLLRLNILPFALEYIHFTQFQSFEFHVVLKKDCTLQSDKTRREKEIARISSLIENERDNKTVLQSMYERMRLAFDGHVKNYIYGIGVYGEISEKNRCGL